MIFAGGGEGIEAVVVHHMEATLSSDITEENLGGVTANRAISEELD